MSNKKIVEKVIGSVGVDSGMLLISDPCYIEKEWEHSTKKETTNPDSNFKNKKYKGQFSYNGCANATLTEEQGGELNFGKGLTGAGVAITTGFGDGLYPVVAKLKDYGTEKNPDWKVKEVIIKFIKD